MWLSSYNGPQSLVVLYFTFIGGGAETGVQNISDPAIPRGMLLRIYPKK
jgi:hypothetical protein